MLRLLINRREIWWPTKWGWLILCALVLAPAALWWFVGERCLSPTARLPAEILAVESWIGREGVHAAKAEFERGPYTLIVVTGAPIENRLAGTRWDYAEYMHRELLGLGLPPDKVVLARTRFTDRQRTFESATAVGEVLRQRGLNPKAVNILTIGAHARRSRLVFARVLSPANVGVVSHRPSSYPAGPWWRSSERAEDFLKESVGYLYELFLHSGRWTDPPSPSAAEDSPAPVP